MMVLARLLRMLSGTAAAAPAGDDALTRAALDAFADRLVLYHLPTCPYCLLVRGRLRQLGLAVELRDISEGLEHRNALIAGGGKPTVPCLRIEQDDGSQIWMYESRDIAAWLQAETEAIRGRGTAS